MICLERAARVNRWFDLRLRGCCMPLPLQARASTAEPRAAILATRTALFIRKAPIYDCLVLLANATIHLLQRYNRERKR